LFMSQCVSGIFAVIFVIFGVFFMPLNKF
jgi:succinate dehydrogenase hydrophobic anchor subunit